MGVDDDFVPEVAVVTGGRGFLARHMVLQLLEKTEYVIKILDLAPTINLSGEEEKGKLGAAVRLQRVTYTQADLRDKASVSEALKGVTSVFHMAAPDSSINIFQLHYDVSVTGTKNIVDACVQHSVKRLIYTSSPSVVFDGVRTIVNADESMPIPEKHNDFYSEAKAQAEAVVLSSNGKNELLTCAIRPSGIFGPGDKLAVPAAVAAAKAGKLKFFIGDGTNLFDWTYVENVANAHLCADNSLNPRKAQGDSAAAGKAYFITNGQPIRFWEFFVVILEGLGYPSPKYGLPVPLLMPFAFVVNFMCTLLAPLGVPRSQFTPTRLRIMSTTRTFNIGRARRLLGYSPIVPLEIDNFDRGPTAELKYFRKITGVDQLLKDGMKRTIASYPELRSGVQAGTSTRSGASKTRFFLGDKKVADILLWSNTQQSVTVLSFLSFTAYLFFGSGYTFISLTAKLACLALLGLFAYSRLTVLGAPLPSIPPTMSFQLPEDTVYHVALVGRSMWNSAASIIASLQKKGNTALLLKVVLVLQFFRFIGRFSLQVQITVGLVGAFTLPYLYDRNEENFDTMIAHVSKICESYTCVVLSRLPKSVQKYVCK